jgi:hypothetical protein
MKEFQVTIEALRFTLDPTVGYMGNGFFVICKDLDVCFFLLPDENGSLQICGRGITRKVLKYRDGLVEAIQGKGFYKAQ